MDRTYNRGYGRDYAPDYRRSNDRDSGNGRPYGNRDAGRDFTDRAGDEIPS